MCSNRCFVLLVLCVIDKSLSKLFDSEEIVPVRLNGRSSGRFWKRSEEQPRFRLSAFGRDFTLNLSPDNSFLSPTLTIQRIKAKDIHTLRSASGAHGRQTSETEPDFHNLINKTEETERDLRSCFYSGTVDSNQDSVVAVSLCYGILGSFVTDGDEYFIEPKVLGSGRRERSTEQLHFIKRTTPTEAPHDTQTVFGQLSEKSRVKADKDSFIHGEKDPERQLRGKRFVSAPRFIETLVVADTSMTHFYGDEIKVGYIRVI